MLDKRQPLALFLEGFMGRPECKMALGVLRYCRNPVVCAIDSTTRGRRVADYWTLPRDCPIVGSLEEARGAGANVLVLGTAPSGGRIPASYYPHMSRAIELGFSIVNGLHNKLAPLYPDLRPGQWIWDIRAEPEGIGVAVGAAAGLRNQRVLMVGTDMAVGKMTAGLELYREALGRKIRAEFIATGQIGIVIMGRGVPLDAVKVDYACGAMEKAVMDASDAELIVVEGQGALAHPGSAATLPLLRGTCPTHLVLCHRGGASALMKLPQVRIPPLPDLIRLYEDLAATAGVFPRPRTLGIALNTAHMTAEEAAREVEQVAGETGLPVTDVIRFGAGVLADGLREDARA